MVEANKIDTDGELEFTDSNLPQDEKEKEDDVIDQLVKEIQKCHEKSFDEEHCKSIVIYHLKENPKRG